MTKRDAVISELERIKNRHRGYLRPADVVREARAPKSPLHRHFDWSDTVAAHKWRLHQARNIIRVLVTFVGDGEDKQPMSVFVSLYSNRDKEHGYLAMVDVLTDKDLRQQLLDDALKDMQVFQEKYAGLKELSELFRAMKRTGMKLRALV
jgi:hypothetical protein